MIRYNSPWLLAGGLVAAVAAAVFVGWGRVRSVEVPRPARWAHVASVCPGPGVRLAEPMRLLLTHEQAVRAEPGACDGRSAIHVEISEADIDRLRPSEATWDAVEVRGVYERTITLGTITDCRVYVADGADTAAIVHEVAHCLGHDHPRNAPTGHVMHPDYARLGLSDWRGVTP